MRFIAATIQGHDRGRERGETAQSGDHGYDNVTDEDDGEAHRLESRLSMSFSPGRMASSPGHEDNNPDEAR